MIIGGTLLEHGEKYAATVADQSTIRRIHEGLTRAIAEHLSIADEIKDSDARADYLEVFSKDVERCRAVIKICENRMSKWPA